MKNDKVMVSIICTSYNHGEFIAEAIESFLMQKTDFAFEILIHDDASTDHTAQIIREYEKKYPDLIKPIYQNENQYSQGVLVELINHERAKGKYIAVCEGDDYWTSPYKLQKQVDYMESHPECSMCVHAASKVSAKSHKVVAPIRPSKRDKVFSVAEVIEGGGGLFATNSIMYSKEKVLKMPSFYMNATVGDYPLVIYSALQGTIFYMDENMSAYRVEVNGSWTNTEVSNIENKIKHYDDIADMLDEINRYTNFRYHEVIERTKKRDRFFLLLKQHKFKEALKSDYKECYMHTGFLKKVIKKLIV
ncbi:glycosyltransferase family 2 protein [Planococcus salinus]|uniref:Glycosyltransferase family 2 protein n=1 Tax=Planococcus salinus TaxID=1848460 RepID=A0A3M8P780_9BACL|nr:glycosyltransferase family 2 protein [Planococcus salinus]RNF39526.1 glycosyltransferase family 2 protein [Planococcus salinus]